MTQVITTANPFAVEQTVGNPYGMLTTMQSSVALIVCVTECHLQNLPGVGRHSDGHLWDHVGRIQQLLLMLDRLRGRLGVAQWLP